MVILFAWELGGGLGHLARHLELARALAARKHQVLFAVKDLAQAQTLLKESGFGYFQSPQLARAQTLQRPMCSFADVLAFHGMADADTGTPLLHAWVQLLKLCRASVVVIDHAPAALFAARCLGVKTLDLGTGFCNPPSVTPYPVFRQSKAAPDTAHLAAEKACLALLNAFGARHHLAPFTSLAVALQSTMALLPGFPELDHYPQRGRGHFVGPTESFSGGVALPWQGKCRYRVFVYLRHHPGLPGQLAQLAQLDAEVHAYCPSLSEADCLSLATEHLYVSCQPLQLSGQLPACDLVVSNGGHGLLSACILYGVPALVLPRHLEQQLMARAVVRAGFGKALLPSATVSKFAEVVTQLLQNLSFKQAATALQTKYSAYSFPATRDRLVATLEKIGHPLVSCLCVTRGRVALLRRAVACFTAQTYPARELVLVYPSDDAATRAYVQTILSPMVRAMEVSAEQNQPLGELRNLAVSAAEGDYIAQWDDDDWHAPTRLEAQLAAIRASGKTACVLLRWTMYDTLTQSAYLSQQRHWEGTLVAQRQSLPTYPALSKAEDRPVVQQLAAAQALVTLDRPALYVYTVHSANTWGRGHWLESIQPHAKLLSPQMAQRIAKLLALGAT